MNNLHHFVHCFQYFGVSDDLGFGFQVQHYGTSGLNRFKNKTLGVS